MAKLSSLVIALLVALFAFAVAHADGISNTDEVTVDVVEQNNPSLITKSQPKTPGSEPQVEERPDSTPAAPASPPTPPSGGNPSTPAGGGGKCAPPG
jgi:hypothetical protein